MKKRFSIISIIVLVAVILLVLFSRVEIQALQDLIQRKTANNAIQNASTVITLPRPGSASPTVTGHGNAPGIPYVQSTQLYDGSGHPMMLRGAQIESAFNYIDRWQRGERPTTQLNSTTFNVMVRDWKMNILRLPISNWIEAKDPVNYMSQLDQVIQQANAAGLYVVMDLHDDLKSGSPYGDTATLLKTEDLNFWKFIAAHFKNNNMVMFDLFNEPKGRTWQTWLHGNGSDSGSYGGAKVVGTQAVVDAIRAIGGKQIIIVEPGSAGGYSPSKAGWATVGTNTIKDPNIMYSLHIYQEIPYSTQMQDARWGAILGHFPIYYGEWAMLPNGYGQPGIDHCKGIPHNQADQVVTNFLNYMAMRHANWTAWSFTPNHLILDFNSFTPTTLDIPWTCGDSTSKAGMGTLVKRYLTNA